MIKSLYTAVSAMIAGMTKHSLKTHNVSNVSTPGFKQVFTSLKEFQHTEVYLPEISEQKSTQQSIGEIGLGVMTMDINTKFTKGALQVTQQSLDFAIQGNGFFRIMTPFGERFTRDGRFSLDSNGSLVTVDGNRVLDSAGKPIQIPTGELEVNTNGEFFINGRLTAQLGLAEFPQPESQLERDMPNSFKTVGDSVPIEGNSTVHQGYLEMSNVNVVDMMVGGKTYEAAQKIVQTQGELLGKTINILGKST
jgi:flagellar basal-body rod protein FlgF